VLITFAQVMPQQPSYSNAKALFALIRASLRSTTKSPSAIIFTIAFPLIFIMVFGFLGGDKMFSIGVATAPGTDTSNQLYAALHEAKMLKWVDVKDSADIHQRLEDGDIAAVIGIQQQPQGSVPAYKVVLQGASSQMDKVAQLQGIVRTILQNTDAEIVRRTDSLASVEVQVATVREFKTIDFVLPGQLGFSLLAGSVFGTAFIFYNLRQTLVLKRFFATPVRREVIVVSEGIARMVFQLLGAIVIITVGYFVFDYTLINGIVTFLELILLSALAILVFMGFGFIISGIAKSETTIPPISNIVTLPQFLLAGTFFPIDVFPKWLQPFCKILPLTYLNDAMRKVAFDGAGFWDIRVDILVLLAWGVVLYIIAGRVFRWE
jgi:ABC-2 type transport system permease protein